MVEEGQVVRRVHFPCRVAAGLVAEVLNQTVVDQTFLRMHLRDQEGPAVNAKFPHLGHSLGRRLDHLRDPRKHSVSKDPLVVGAVVHCLTTNIHALEHDDGLVKGWYEVNRGDLGIGNESPPMPVPS